MRNSHTWERHFKKDRQCDVIHKKNLEYDEFDHTVFYNSY